MSVLSKNIHTIRKELRCTQGVMADLLKTGFRTYVRYEAGERDAPVTFLVRLARLGNVSIERLLTEELSRDSLSPLLVDQLDNSLPDIKSCNLKAGTINFRKPVKESLIAINTSERRLLSLFRKMEKESQSAFLKTMAKTYKVSGVAKPPSKDRKLSKYSSEENRKILAQAGSIKPSSGREVGRPGRKKLDRKSLKEKITKLKQVTRSVPKITVS